MRCLSLLVYHRVLLDWYWTYCWPGDGFDRKTPFDTAIEYRTSILTLYQVVGCFLACISAYLNGVPGAKHFLGYGMLARTAFGLWGSYFCVMLNVFQSFVFYGTQMYFGGEAFVIILNSLSPGFLHLKNTLPERYGYEFSLHIPLMFQLLHLTLSSMLIVR